MSVFVLILFFVFNGTAESRRQRKEKPQNQLTIAATIFPLADIAKEITKENAKVLTILPAGANPHAFELSPKTVRALQNVRAIFMIGHNLDEWVRQAGQDAKEVIVDQNINLIVSNDGTIDPHYWLSIENIKQISKTITNVLIEIDPLRKEEYLKNLESYLSVLDDTDHQIKQLFSTLESREMVTYHDGWQYFARDYNLNIAGNVESGEGNEPTPGRLRVLGYAVSKYKIKALFSEPETSKSTAESMARDFGLQLYELDPFGGPGKSFSKLLLENAQTIHKALHE